MPGSRVSASVRPHRVTLVGVLVLCGLQDFHGRAPGGICWRFRLSCESPVSRSWYSVFELLSGSRVSFRRLLVLVLLESAC